MAIAGEGTSSSAEPAEAISPAEARFERYRKLVGLLLAPVAFVGTMLLLSDSHLKPEAQKLSAILAAVCVFWITEVVPLPVTALLGAVACVVMQVADAKVVLAPFADPIIFLFLGSFILARAMMLHALDRRVALAFLSIGWIAASPARILAGLGLVTALVSMWVSNTATTAMMLPIALGVLGALQRARGDDRPLRQWPYASGMMLMIAYSASIGGIGTPVGSPPNLIGIALIRKHAEVSISFFTWMTLCLPMLALMGVVLFLMLRRLCPAGEGHEGAALRQYLLDQRRALGGWTAGQINTLLAFAVAVLLWILPGLLTLLFSREHPSVAFMEKRLPESIVALLAIALLFVLPTSLRRWQFTLNWSQASQIDWGTILLFGGGLSLGGLMFSTGVAQAMGESLTAITGAQSVWAMTAVSIAIAIILSEATSNTAAANMVVPVVIALGKAAGINPVPAALGATLGASYGFMLPVSTPPNAIAYGSGLVPITRMIRAGLIFDLAGFVVIFAGLRLLCPLLGLV
jgi:sodium-dependent dicarboxylate transporter 2/3/5